ncbi:MAG: LamG-like jellyroll fold domain-containing protein, partial [Chloroflexota bacterium]
DENIHSDVPLMLLTHGLEQAYLNPRDCDALTSEGACIGDGDIDLTLGEIETRFHNPTNQNISQTKSWGLDDNFRVEQFSYDHVDEMLVHTTVTNTNRILNEHFTSHWEASNPLAPTLLFIREETFQSANLDGLATTTAVQTASGNRLLVFNLSAADAPLAMKVTSLNWAPYQFNSATQSWGSYDVAAYLGEILTPRLEAEPDLPEATDLQNDGAEYISLLYYYIMNRGLSNAVGVDFQGVEPDDLIEPFSTDEHITFNIVINIFAISTFKHFTGGILNLSKNETLYDFAGKAKQADAADNVDDATQSARNKSLDDIQYGMFDDIKNLKTILENADNQYSTLRRVTAVGNVALVIIAVIGLTLFIIGDITNNTPLAIAGGLMMAAFLVVYLVVQPLVVTVRAVQALSAATGVSRASATLSVLGSQSNLIGASKIGGAIGLAVSIGIIWGIFIYQVADGGYSPGSFEFNTLLAAAIAATIVAILLFIISTSVVGAIIVGILSFIDLLLFIICEAEDNDDCFTISGEITSWLAGHIYQYDTLIDLKEDDLITVGDFQTLFSEPNLGLIAGNELTMRLPVDIKIKNKATKDVGAASDRFYDGETIKKSAFTFSMTEEPEKIGATKNSMKNEWDVSKIGTAIYEITHGTIPPWKETRKITLRQAEASKIVDAEPVVLEAGMNQKYSFYFNTGVSLPAYECWVDECKSKTINQKIKGEDKLGPFFFDVFPADVETFYELAWISSRQQDHDGDDLISTDFGGPDPNDSVSGCPTGMCYDTDGDGLSDKYEINASAFGIGGFDAEKADTDGDGLTDLEELIHGSDPALKDTDGDGLTDSVEVSGWPFTYAQGKQVQAYSSPLLRDTDGDGLSDAAEKNLHETNLTAFPYHPAVFNENPIGFSGSLSGSGVYLPGTNFSYTATVKNTLVENIYADGTLDIRYPAQIISVDEQEQFSIPAGGAIEFVANKQINPSASSITVEIENDIFAGLFQSQQAGEAYLGDSELLEKISVTIDNDPPSSDMTTVPFVIPGGIRIIGGVATDPTSYIDFVEVRIDGGPWQLATGAESWAYAWEVPVTSGSYTFEIRATDIVGNQQANPSQVTIEVDSTPPAASAAAEFDNNAFVFATRNVDGLWEIELDGSVTDNASGVRHLDVVVEPNGSGWLRADYNKNTDSWSAVYELSTSRSTDPFAVDASGQYTVSLRPVDLALNDGNSAVYTFPLRIDTTPPNVSLDSLKPINELGNIIEINTAPITQTTMLTGTITDPGDFAIGISEVEIAFTPYEVFQTLDQQALWVSFDEGTGSNTFRDQSISDKEGICLINRCPESGMLGRFGSAIQLTNIPAEQEDYVEILDLDVSEAAYSSALWFRTTCADCGLFSLDEKAELFAEHDRDIFLLGGNVCAEVGGAASPICSADANYADDQWHMAVQTIGADGGHLLYVDGQLAADGPETSSPNTIQDSVNIGYAPAANTPYLNGQIDEVRVFNQELTADEVRGLFQSWTAFAPVAPTLTSSEWQYQVPEGLEGNYQIDLTGSDQFNNRNDQRQSWQQWRGEIDTKVPDLEISVEYTGTRMTAQTIISGVAKDSNLSTDGYQFPCALEAADYHFDDEGQLVKLTPSCSLAGWQTKFNYLRVCDRYGHCAAITPDLYHIYWTLGDGLFRAPLSGAATTKDDVQKLLVSDNDPQGLVLDIDGGKVYWAEGGLADSAGEIKRANLDGSEIEQLVSGLPSLDQNSGHWRPDQRIGLAIDLGANQMYYGQANDGGIWRANLDGSGMSQIIDTLALNGANSRLSWIKLDQTNGNIYWLMGRNGSPWPLEVWMASLNDPQNSAQLIYSDSVDGQFLDGLEVVPADNKIYWTLTNAGEQGVIMQADLDGSNQSILHTGTNFSETNFGAITVEPFSRALYWRTGYVHYEASDNLYMATYPHFRQILQDGSDNQRVYPSTQLNNSRNCGSFCSFADLSIERDGNDLEIERILGTIFTSTDLDIEIVGDSDLAFRNGQNSFEITARNLGPLDAHDVQVDLTLDNAYSVNQMTGCDSVNGASCSLGSLLEGETVTFTVVLDVSGSAIDTLDLNAVLSASKPDHLPVNNQATFVAYYAPERGLPPAGSE